MKRIRKITEELNISDLPQLSYQELKAKYNHILPEGPMPGDGNAVTWGQMWKKEWMEQHAEELDTKPEEQDFDKSSELLQRKLDYQKQKETELRQRDLSASGEESRLKKIDNDKTDIIYKVSNILDATRKMNNDESFYKELNDLINKYGQHLPQIKPGTDVIGPTGVVEKFSDFIK
jgi:hypothetical protein